MDFLKNIRIGKRLTILSISLMTLLVIVATVASVSSRSTRVNVSTMVEDNALNESLYYLIMTIWKASDPPTDYLATGDTDNRAAYEEDYQAVTKALAEVEKAATVRGGESPLEKIKAALKVMDTASRSILAFENPVGNTQAQDIMEQLDTGRTDASATAIEWSKQVDAENSKTSAATMAQTARTIWLVLILLAVAITIGIVLSYFITKSIKQPLDHLLETTGAIAAGDLSHTVSLDTKDELGQLGSSFNKMVTNIREILNTFGKQMVVDSGSVTLASQQVAAAMSQISLAIQEVANGAGQQSESAEETLQAMKALQVAIEQIAEGARVQGESAQQAADIMHKMAEAANIMARGSQEVAETSNQALQAAHGGGESVQQTVQGMARIRLTSEEASNRVRELGEQSQRIGEIVQVISDLADQTNLLALNAAIEAARAGEHGKGFAVVAEEVRKLAERSGRATKDIADLISTIQKGVDSAIEAMAAGMKEVENGDALANSAGESLSQILAAMERTNSKIDEIRASAHTVAKSSEEAVASVNSVVEIIRQNTDATTKMADASDRVLASIQGVAAVSQQTAAAAEEVSASAEEVTQSTELIRNSASSLNETASKLNALIGSHSG